MNYKESFDDIQRHIDAKRNEIISEPSFIYEIERKIDVSQIFNDSLSALFHDLFSPEKDIFISSLTKFRDLLQSNAYYKINYRIKEVKNKLLIPQSIIKRLHEIVHLRFHFKRNQTEDVDNIENIEEEDINNDYEEDFDNEDGDDIKFIALECLSFLLVDDAILQYYDETSIFNDFITYYTNESSIFAFIIYCNHSKFGRMKVFQSNIIENILNVIEQVNIKFSTLCSLCNSLFLYPFKNDEECDTIEISDDEYLHYFEQCLHFFMYITSKWEMCNFNDKTLILACLNTIVSKQKEFNDFSILQDFINKVFDNSNLLNEQYIKQCINFFINIFSLPKHIAIESDPYKQKFVETKQFALDNGFFDFLFAIIEKCLITNSQYITHILKPICILVEMAFITYAEEIIDDEIWKKFVEIYDSCQYDLQLSIVIGFTSLILNDDIMDVRLFTLTDSDDVFRIMSRIEPLADSDIFLPIVNTLIRLSSFSFAHNSTAICSFISEDSDFHEWVENFFEETSDPSFKEEKDPNIVNAFNDNVRKWLFLQDSNP